MSGLAFVYSNRRMSSCSMSIGECLVGECLIGVYGYTIFSTYLFQGVDFKVKTVKVNGEKVSTYLENHCPELKLITSNNIFAFSFFLVPFFPHT